LVLREGQIQVDDNIKTIKKDKSNVTVKDIVHAYITGDRADNIETIMRAIKIMAVSGILPRPHKGNNIWELWQRQTNYSCQFLCCYF